MEDSFVIPTFKQEQDARMKALAAPRRVDPEKWAEHSEMHQRTKVLRKAARAADDFGPIVPDKLEMAKSVNISLKRHQIEMETDIKLMQTQMSRLLSRLKTGGGAAYEKDLDRLVEEQVRLDQDNSLMNMKIIKAKRRYDKDDYSVQKNLKSTFSGSLKQGKRPMSAMKRSGSTRDVSIGQPSGSLDPETQLMIQKDKLAAQIKHIGNLKRQILELKTSTRSDQSVVLQNDNIRDLETKVYEKRQTLVQMDQDIKFKKRECIRNEEQKVQMHEQIVELGKRKMDIINRMRDNLAIKSEEQFIRQQIDETRKEREALQRQYDNLMKDKFCQKIVGQDKFEGITKKSQECDFLKEAAKKNKSKIDGHAKKQLELQHEEQKLEKSKENHKFEKQRLIDKMCGPAGLSSEILQRRLQREFPDSFNQMIVDLRMSKEDTWDTMNQAPASQSSAKQELTALDKKKSMLITILSQKQNELRLQVEGQNEKLNLVKAEIKHQRDINKRRQQEIQELSRIHIVRTETIEDLAKVQPKDTRMLLTADNLQKLGLHENFKRFDDAQSEFTVMTEESELMGADNVLDLKLSCVKYDNSKINQFLGIKDAVLDSAVQTFLTVEFFDHDIKYTEVVNGYDPDFETQFSFKNFEDYNFLDHLYKKSIRVEVFVNSRPVGEANIQLIKVLSDDTTFQMSNIIHVVQGHEVVMGQLCYRHRMRKPINIAKKEQILRENRVDELPDIKSDPSYNMFNETSRYGQKILQITVGQAMGLKRSDPGCRPADMAPYFSYDFYKFNGTSSSMYGNKPDFGFTKCYEIADSTEFRDYLRSQTLKINFIDDNVDFTADVNDFIGCVSIKLDQLLECTTIEENRPIIDDKMNQNGIVMIKLELYDSHPVKAQVAVEFDSLEKQVITAIADKFAQQGPNDLESILDMLFFRFQGGPRASTEAFKEFILVTLRANVTQQDLDIFVGGHRVFQNGSPDMVEMDQLLEIFIRPFSQALSKVQDDSSQSKTIDQKERPIIGIENVDSYTMDRNRVDLQRSYLDATLNDRTQMFPSDQLQF